MKQGLEFTNNEVETMKENLSDKADRSCCDFGEEARRPRESLEEEQYCDLEYT